MSYKYALNIMIGWGLWCAVITGYFQNREVSACLMVFSIAIGLIILFGLLFGDSK